ncbi:MAG: hypothetical protein M1812_006695 [Candelaria pacifica]|nr:MAG: hypothetical protein M1812_006695 [Candelaria pacifica]
MLNRIFKRSVLDTRIPLSNLPPTFLLPLRARLFNTSTPFIDETTPEYPPPPATEGRPSGSKDSILLGSSNPQPLYDTRGHVSSPPRPNQNPTKLDSLSSMTVTGQATQPSDITTRTPSVTTPDPADSLSDSIKTLLPLLRAQTPHFITIHIHGRPYLLTAGDILRLPFLMPSVTPGDILRLNRATHLGSREYTLKGSPYVNESLFVCRARVMGVEAEPMRIMEKTKRRQRHVKTVRSKHKFTILRVTEVRIRGLGEVDELSDEGDLVDEAMQEDLGKQETRGIESTDGDVAQGALQKELT